MSSDVNQRPLADWIESYWSDADRRRSENWIAHEDINSVMLATSLQFAPQAAHQARKEQIMPPTRSDDFSQQRRQMVDLIWNRGIRDVAVCNAFRDVRREAFVPEQLREFAYQDAPLPIGNDQTISQPYVVALMTAVLELEETDRVLEIGTGSGYAAAILSRIAEEVYTVERIAELAETARRQLAEEGFDNVHVLHGDGTLGWPEHAPYDSIVVAAGGPDVPQPLLDQLAVGGRLVIPVGSDRSLQKLVRVTKTDRDSYQREELGDVRFVPLLGTAGWNGAEPEVNRQT